MNGAGLVAELYSNTGTTSLNYSSTNAFIDLNKSYHFIEDLLTQEIGESYFYNEVITPTVVGQKEYTLYAQITGNLDGQAKTFGVSINYGNGYKKAIKADMNLLPNDSDWYKTNQDSEYPIYTIQDSSIMIFPVPKAAGSLKSYIVQNLVDIDVNTVETSIWNGKIHKKYHPIISLGAEQYCYIRRQLKNDAQEANTRFMQALFGGNSTPGLLDMLNTRVRGAKIRQMPSGYAVRL